MNRWKKLGALVLVLIILCAALAVIYCIDRIKANTKESGQTLLQLQKEEIESIAWTFQDVTLSFEKTASGSWICRESPDYQLNSDDIDIIVENLCSMSAKRVIENPPAGEDYGLKKPHCTAAISSGEGTVILTYGNLSSSGDKRYLSVGDGKVYLVNKIMADIFTTTLEELSVDTQYNEN